METGFVRKLNRFMARIEYNYPLLSHNTFGIEAYADRFVAYDSVEDLRQVVRRLRADCPDVPVLHIGGGSNLLFRHRWNRV